MENKQIYEYVVVKAEWFGTLDRGTRLYWDYDKQGYTYHYEHSSTDKESRYESKSFETRDYFISIDVAESQIKSENLVAGPDLGVLEINK